MSGERRLPPPLLALTPGRLRDAEVDAFVRAVEGAWSAGLRGVLLREPHLSDRAFLSLAERLRAVLLADDGGWLALHDRAHLAATIRADGVHVGFRSLSLREVRPWMPAQCTLGFSSHSGDGPDQWELADYLFFGPVLDTPSKRGVVDAVGFETLKEFAGRSSRPIWALGGLQPEHCAQALASGAAGVAALGSLLGSDEPAAAAERWHSAMEKALK